MLPVARFAGPTQRFINGAPVRGMATQKQLKQRMKSIKTIMKVTKAMKMVASSRTKVVNTQLQVAREFQQEISALLQPEESTKRDGENWLLVPYAADKGLCGAINSSVVRESKRQYNDNVGKSSATKVLPIGTKVIGGMARFSEKNFLLAISDQKPGKRMTFKQISVIGETLRNADWSRATVVYNRFKNALSYVTTAEQIHRFDHKAPLAKSLLPFEQEGDQDILKNLDEFRLAVRLWHVNAEHESSEISSRVNAMENSNKAAREMADKLNLKMNKLRQAKITLEICDIVAGAESAL